MPPTRTWPMSVSAPASGGEGSRGVGGLGFAVEPLLLAPVSAYLHGAPPPGARAGVVVEGPLAGVVVTCLESGPGPVDGRGGNDTQQVSYQARGAVSRGRPSQTSPGKDRSHVTPRHGAVEDLERPRVCGSTVVVRQENRAQRFSQLDQVGQVIRRRRRWCQADCLRPGVQLVGGAQVILVVLHVEGVHERPDVFQTPWRYRSLAIVHNPILTNVCSLGVAAPRSR